MVLNDHSLSGAGTASDRTVVVMAGPLPPAVGGMASVIAALQASGLSAAVQLQLFETGKVTPPNRPLLLGIKTRLKVMRDWWRVLGQRPDTVAHIHTCSGFTFFLDGLLVVIARMRGVPVIMHVHGARFDAFLDGLSFPLAAIARWLSVRAQVVIVLSPEWRERLQLRWPRAALEVVANGVSWPQTDGGAVGDDGVPRFVFLGNLGRRKGVHRLLEAASLAREPWLLDLAGGEEDPGFMAFAQAEIARLGLASRVRVLGPVVGQAKEELLGRAQGFVLPSLAEGLPMSMLEAMAVGLPVVVSAVGAMPEVVRQGVDGLVVPADDAAALAAALDDLSRSPARRSALGASASARCRSLYGIDRMVEALLAVYGQLSASKR